MDEEDFDMAEVRSHVALMQDRDVAAVLYNIVTDDEYREADKFRYLDIVRKFQNDRKPEHQEIIDMREHVIKNARYWF